MSLKTFACDVYDYTYERMMNKYPLAKEDIKKLKSTKNKLIIISCGSVFILGFFIRGCI